MRKISQFFDIPERKAFWVGLLLITALAFFTYFFNYWYPNSFYWDENYHVASAQKYLHGIFFMEPHPPLGKLLIALGEHIFGANAVTDQFIGTDYAGYTPTDISFVGYRFFPALLGWLSAPVIFLLFYLFTSRALWATLLSFFYVFDNAMVVHSRGAMLDSTLTFFSLLTLLFFFLIIRWKDTRHLVIKASIGLGIAFACALGTKAFGLLFILCYPLLAVALYKNKYVFIRSVLYSAGAFLIVYVSIWHTHFMLGHTVNPHLSDNGYYEISVEYEQLLDSGNNASLLYFPLMLRDSWRFLPHYAEGVPQLNLCKEDENGSPFFLWPFGGHSISYRWETPDGNLYQYLYLQSNPVVWGVGLLALFLSVCFLIAKLLFPIKKTTTQDLFPFYALLALYASFMLAISQIERVMYMYHYFIPLLFTLLLIPFVLKEIQQFATIKLSDSSRTWILATLGLLVFLAFHFFQVFTYYDPIDEQGFRKRMWSPIWNLRCVHCTEQSWFGKSLIR